MNKMLYENLFNIKADILPVRTFRPPFQISKINDRAKNVFTPVRISKVKKLDISLQHRFRRVIYRSILGKVTFKRLVSLSSSTCGKNLGLD
jgi:hypothetical protein